MQISNYENPHLPQKANPQVNTDTICKILIDNLDKALVLALNEDLTRIVWQAAQHNPVLMKVAVIHATFLTTVEDSALISAVGQAATVDEHVPYTEADSYCQIIDEIVALVNRVADTGKLALAIQLGETAISAGEISSENIMDDDYWQMSLDDIAEMSGALKKMLSPDLSS